MVRWLDGNGLAEGLNRQLIIYKSPSHSQSKIQNPQIHKSINHQPQFSLDHLSRHSMRRVTGCVLNKLRC